MNTYKNLRIGEGIVMRCNGVQSEMRLVEISDGVAWIALPGRIGLVPLGVGNAWCEMTYTVRVRGIRPESVALTLTCPDHWQCEWRKPKLRLFEVCCN